MKKRNERCVILRENNTRRAYRDTSIQEIKSIIEILMSLNKKVINIFRYLEG